MLFKTLTSVDGCPHITTNFMNDSEKENKLILAVAN